MGIKLKNLVIQRGSFELGPLNFVFEDSGLYLVKGKNGSGKSSLLKAMLGRLRMKSGTIERSYSQIASVGIEPVLYNEWTIRDNHDFISKISGCPVRLKEKNSYPLDNFFNVGQLSSGQKRMAELQIALDIQSPILLLDEPGNSLDSENLSYLEARLEEESRTRLIIMTSHLQSTNTMTFRSILEI